MPATLTPSSMPSTAPPLAALPAISFTGRIRWTADECDRMEQLGLLPQKYELLDGEIIDKMGQYMPHTFSSGELYFFLRGITHREQVTNQGTILVAPEDAPHNRPEPDAAVLRAPRPRDTGIPQAADIMLVAEVSDATLADDLGYKAGLYARANISEYWVLDVNARRVVVHLLPVNGRYTSGVAYDANRRIAPAFAPNQSVLVGDLL